MEFACSICNYTSPIKKNVARHINNKTKCGEGEPEILEIPVDIFCEYCDKAFTIKSNLNRHLKTCKAKKSIYDDEVEKLKEKIEKLEEALIQKPTTITNNVNSTTINNNIIIQITPYNDPNMDGVEKYYKEAVKKLFMSVPTIIERIHFNEEFPENHNICIKNFRTKMAKVFNGREWKTMDEDRLINELVDTYERLLEDWAEEKPERMKYIENYKEIKRRDGPSKVNKDLKDEVKKLIYDKRDMVKLKN